MPLDFDPEQLIHPRMRAIDASGIRRVFDLAADLDDPINLSIGQPDFDVPEPIKRAATDAIATGHNRYTVTQGIAELRDTVNQRLADELPNWKPGLANGDTGTLITSGVSGGLLLTLMATVGPGDEVLIPDPYFVMYKHLVTLTGAAPVLVDTYPDFIPTPEKLAPYLTERSKLLFVNSPSNPTGVTLTPEQLKPLVDFAHGHNLLLVSDEIYDEFCHNKTEQPPGSGHLRCPSPASFSDRLILLRGYSKTYAMTGWRMGYAVGPKPILEQMTKLQQYSFVCAPSIAQHGALAAFDVDMSTYVAAYRQKRDRLVDRLTDAGYELALPTGAFYAFPRVPEHLGLTGTQFVERAIERNTLIIPGCVFSEKDTHFRISYACDPAMLDRGLDVLASMAEGH